MCDQIAAGEPRIRVVHQQNQGLSGARNTGIRAAKAEYVVFLDSDDEWLLPDGIEKLLLQQEHTDLIVFKRVDVWNNKSITSLDYDIDRIAKQSSPQAIFSYLVETQQLQRSACFLLVRRQVLIDHKIFFPLKMISEDIFWNLHLWQHLTSVRFTNLDFYGYYHRESSITTTTNIRTYHSYDQIFTYWKSQCEEGCTNADAIRSFLANMWVSRGYDYYALKDAEKSEALLVLKKHTDLLNYGISPKSKRTRKMVKLIGVRATVVVLGWYWQLRSLVKH